MPSRLLLGTGHCQAEGRKSFFRSRRYCNGLIEIKPQLTGSADVRRAENRQMIDKIGIRKSTTAARAFALANSTLRWRSRSNRRDD